MRFVSSSVVILLVARTILLLAVFVHNSTELAAAEQVTLYVLRPLISTHDERIIAQCNFFAESTKPR